MSRIVQLTCLLLLVLGTGPAVAQDCPEPEPAKMMEIQQKMMAMMGPGPEHDFLSKMAGEWTGEVKMWIQPGMDPITSSLVSTNELVLGGRFLQIRSNGSMMGMPVESLNYIGYDRRHEQYTAVGFDTMGTYYITAAGALAEDSNVLTVSGTDEDPLMGITQSYDFQYEVIDENTHVLRLIFHCPSFGTDGPYKLMEATYSRKQG